MQERQNGHRPNDPQARLWVALEGPCCAGKTTLARHLAQRLPHLGALYVECYADHAGGGRYLPRTLPESLEEDAQALKTLLEIEASRTAPDRLGDTEVIVLDRSVHTFLAHRYAVEQLTGLACYAPAQQILTRFCAPPWPDLVIYLDVPQSTVNDRNGGKFSPGNILVDPAFNAAFRSYFCKLRSDDKTPVAWLDATLAIDGLTSAVASRIEEALAAKEEGPGNEAGATLRKGGIR